MTQGQKLRRKEIEVLNEIFAKIRGGKSLYASCLAVGISTRAFYRLIALDAKMHEEFMMALSDYADQCTDDIRTLAQHLKAGEIDNSTAKLLIETTKWLAQKACPEPLNTMEIDEAEKLAEIESRYL